MVRTTVLSFQEEIEKLSQGAAIKNVASVKVLKEISVHVPTLENQKAIIRKLDEYNKETSKLHETYSLKLIALKELKQSLLQKAFTGELANDKQEAA